MCCYCSLFLAWSSLLFQLIVVRYCSFFNYYVLFTCCVYSLCFCSLYYYLLIFITFCFVFVLSFSIQLVCMLQSLDSIIRCLMFLISLFFSYLCFTFPLGVSFMAQLICSSFSCYEDLFLLFSLLIAVLTISAHVYTECSTPTGSLLLSLYFLSICTCFWYFSYFHICCLTMATFICFCYLQWTFWFLNIFLTYHLCFLFVTFICDIVCLRPVYSLSVPALLHILSQYNYSRLAEVH